MKYILIFFYLTQVCAPCGSGIEAPPYFYYRSYDTLEEALKDKELLPLEAKGIIFYGKPEFLTIYDLKTESKQTNFRGGEK